MFNLPICLLLALLGSTSLVLAEPLFPSAQGTTWEYEVIGPGTIHSNLTVRIQGNGKVKGKDLLRRETLSGNDLLKTELIAIDEGGVRCYERTLGEGKTVSFDPPQTVLPAALKIGTQWELDDVVAGNEMHQRFTVSAEEDIVVPAGTFHAYHIQCDEPWPLSITIERWFVPGVGIVKDITTTRGPSGRLLNRVTLALRKFSPAPPPNESNATPSPEVTPGPAVPLPPQLRVEVAKTRDGEAVTEFRSDVPNIYVRWSGRNLPLDGDVRIAWIVEDVGDVAPPNFVVDETVTSVTTTDFGARFTLSRPKDGWAPGKYRIELHLNDELMAKLSVTIRD